MDVSLELKKVVDVFILQKKDFNRKPLACVSMLFGTLDDLAIQKMDVFFTVGHIFFHQVRFNRRNIGEREGERRKRIRKVGDEGEGYGSNLKVIKRWVEVKSPSSYIEVLKVKKKKKENHQSQLTIVRLVLWVMYKILAKVLADSSVAKVVRVTS